MNKVQPHAKYRPGDVVTLKAVRASEMGVFLDAGTGNTDDDILLHKLQQETEVKVGDSVKVYLYLDPHGRLTASMKLPKMREGQLGYVKVLSVTRDGGFVDIGAERGVFLPYSQMRGHVSLSAQSAAYFCRTARCAGMCRRGSLYGLSCTAIKRAVRL